MLASRTALRRNPHDGATITADIDTNQCCRADIGENRSWLTYTDSELWDLIRARTECRDARLAEVVQWMRNCRDRTGSQGSTKSEMDGVGVRS
jgi:hypothetical protein